jgi:hypothetical protein
MEPLIEEHIDELHEHNHRHTDEWLMKEHKNWFTSWLREHDIPDEKTIEEHTIKVLALDHHARSRHGKPMTLVASHTVPSPRTKRACHRTVEFDVTPYTLKLVRKLHTLASLRIYEN